MLDTLVTSPASRREFNDASQSRTHDQEASGALTNEILVDAVDQALRATGYSALRKLDIECSAGVIILWGRVPTYHQKQLAQAVAQKVAGVGRVANGVEVNCVRRQ